MNRRLTAAAASIVLIVGILIAGSSPAAAQCSRLNPNGTLCDLSSLINPARPQPGQSTISSSSPPGPTFVWADSGEACDAASSSEAVARADLNAAIGAQLTAAAEADLPDEAGDFWIGRLVDPVTGPTNSGFTSCVSAGAIPSLPPPLPTAEEIWGAALTFVPEVNLDPYIRGLTGLETHMWYEGLTADSATLTLNGYGVTADIEAIEFRWDMDGPSRDDLQAYSSLVAGSSDLPAATHTYAVPGEVEIVHEVVWIGASVLTGPGLPAGGISVDLGAAILATARDYDVIEVRTPLVAT
jgi:hypothetical protein